VEILHQRVQLTSSGVWLLDDSSLESLESSSDSELSAVEPGGGFFPFLSIGSVAARFEPLDGMTRERLRSGSRRAWVCGLPCLAGLASACMQGISAELPSRPRIAAGGDSDLIRIRKDCGKFEPPAWNSLPSAMFRAEGGRQKPGR